MSERYEYEGWSYDRFRQQRNRAHFLLEDPFRFVTVILLEKPSPSNHSHKLLSQQQQEESNKIEEELLQERSHVSVEKESLEDYSSSKIKTKITSCVINDHINNIGTNRRANLELVCIDSACYHAAGPLGEGNIRDIEDIMCIECPWHKYLVSLNDGCEIFVEQKEANTTDADSNSTNSTTSSAKLSSREMESIVKSVSAITTLKMTEEFVHKVTKGKRVQRIHKAYLNESTKILTIEVEKAEQMKAHPLPSDGPTTRLREGALCMQIFDIKQKSLDQL